MPEPIRVHERLRAHDRWFFEQESPEAAMNVGALVIVDGDRPGEFLHDLRDVFAANLHQAPRLRQRLSDVPLPGAGPVWVDDERFDIASQIRAVALHSPPDSKDLVALAGRLVAEPIGRDGPLWDVAVVPRTAGGECAAIVRWHHALIDGMSGVEIAKLMFSTSAGERHAVPRPWVPESSPTPLDLVGEALAVHARDMFKAAADRVTEWSEREEPSAPSGELLAGLMTLIKLGRLPPNPFPPTVRGARRCATVTIEEAALRAAARRFEVTVEVVVLSIVAGATQRLLRARGDEADTLRVFLPRTVRQRARAETLGNHATFNVLDLPLGAMPEEDRIALVAARVALVRERHQAEAVSALFAGADRVPASWSRAVAQWIGSQTFVHTVVSYMRGPRRPLYLAGRAHRSTAPLLPRNNGLGLLVGVLSLGGITSFGLVADPYGVPELEFFAASLRDVSARLAAPS